MSSQKWSLVCFNSKRGDSKCTQKQQLKFYLPSCQFNITTTFCETQTTTTTSALIKARSTLSKCSCWKQSPIAKLVNFNMLLLKTRPQAPWRHEQFPHARRLVLRLLTCVISCVRISISCSSSTSSNTSGRVECFSCSWPSSCTGGGGGER